MLKSTNPRTLLAGSGARILIVDNDEAFAKFFKIHLSRFFSDVFVTGNPKDALTWFENEPFDLVIIDVNLPRIGGFSLARRIRKTVKDVSIIFTTTFELNEDQKSKIDDNDAVLVKPFTMKEFHSCVKKGLNEKLRNWNPSGETSAEAEQFLEEKKGSKSKEKQKSA